MREDIGLRFSLAAQLNRMPYGHSRIIDRDDAQKAWPPTGNCDRSIEGAFRAMVLTSGGNRPEEDLTTEDRIRRDLDDSFRIEQRPEDGDWIIHRRLSACPHCHGGGIVRVRPKTYLEFHADDTVSMVSDKPIAIETKRCDHRPTVSSSAAE